MPVSTLGAVVRLQGVSTSAVIRLYPDHLKTFASKVWKRRRCRSPHFLRSG